MSRKMLITVQLFLAGFAFGDSSRTAFILQTSKFPLLWKQELLCAKTWTQLSSRTLCGALHMQQARYRTPLQQFHAQAQAAPNQMGNPTQSMPGMQTGGPTQLAITSQSLLEGLNEAQQAAVSAPLGPILVLAGPGSGKTRVLTHRVGYLLLTGETAEGILTVTFTNKAANEMRTRIKAMLGVKTDSQLPVTVGTFHGICVKILRAYGDAIGIHENFNIFDNSQQVELVEQAMVALNMDVEQYKPIAMLRDISKLKSDGFTFEQVDPSKVPPKQKKKMTQIAQAWELYQGELERSNGVDFDDLLIKANTLLKTVPEVRDMLRSRWKHILVDEWQDTNTPQYEFVRLLVQDSPSPSVLVVGDIDQSIYGFRGADIRNVRRFEQDFTGLNRVLLEHNYRSTATIVQSAQSVIERSYDRMRKGMLTTKGAGNKIRVRQAKDDIEEAQFVAKEIKNHVTMGTVEGGYREVAVMFRTNQQCRVFEEQMVKNGIPYYLVGMTKFYARREVLDLMAYIRTLVNRQDTISMLRIINVPTRGIGKKTVEALREYSSTNSMSAFDALQQLKAVREGELRLNLEDYFTTRQMTTLVEFSLIMDTLRQAAEYSTPAELLEVLVNVIGFKDHLLKDEDGDDRWANVLELIDAASRIDTVGMQGLTQYLDEVVLMGDDVNDDLTEEIEIDVDPKKNPKVKLLSLHASKGLEFELAFMVGLEDGILPHVRSFQDTAQMDEERRLMYVGMTRAKTFLYLLFRQRKEIYSNNRAGSIRKVFEPSRYLGDIPEDLITILGPDKDHVLASIRKSAKKTSHPDEEEGQIWEDSARSGQFANSRGRGRGGRTQPPYRQGASQSKMPTSSDRSRVARPDLNPYPYKAPQGVQRARTMPPDFFGKPGAGTGRKTGGF